MVGPGRWALAAIFAAALVSSASAGTVTFDSVEKGTIFDFGATYVEDGLRATCAAGYALFGSTEFGPSRDGLYFQGSVIDGQLSPGYIEFQADNGGTFDLLSFVLMSNALADRWIETSKTGGTQVSLGQPLEDTTIVFSGDDYADISWFRIGTPYFGTEVDDISWSPNAVVPLPAAAVVGLGLLGALGLARRRGRRNLG